MKQRWQTVTKHDIVKCGIYLFQVAQYCVEGQKYEQKHNKIYMKVKCMEQMSPRNVFNNCPFVTQHFRRKFHMLRGLTCGINK